MNRIQVVIAKRTKWHLILGATTCLVFVYPCAFGASYVQSPTWSWLCNVFLFGFVLPTLAYCVYQLKNQKDAIILDGDELHFATMMPWGRSVVKISEIYDCTFESIPEVHDHLILSVSEACFQREHRLRAWAACSEGKLRFDMVYTVPALPKIAFTILRMVKKSREVGGPRNPPESPFVATVEPVFAPSANQRFHRELRLPLITPLSSSPRREC